MYANNAKNKCQTLNLKLKSIFENNEGKILAEAMEVNKNTIFFNFLCKCKCHKSFGIYAFT